MKYLFLLLSLSACAAKQTVDVEKEQLKETINKYTAAEKNSVTVSKLDASKIKTISDVANIFNVLGYTFTESVFTPKEHTEKLDKIRHLIVVEKKEEKK